MKRDDIFRRLEPPPGGLGRLRARIEGRRRGWPILFAIAGAAAMAVVWVATRPRAVDVVGLTRANDETSAVALGVSRMPKEAVVVGEDARGSTAVVEVATSDPRVVFYWVSSTDWGGERR